MDLNNLLVFCLKVSCWTFGIYLFIDILRRAIALKKAKIARFFVKTAFVFERGEYLIGSLIYYNETDFLRAISQDNTNLKEYVTWHLPQLNFPVNTLQWTDINKLGIAKRVVVKKKIVDKYPTLIIAGKNQLLAFNRMGEDPRSSRWFGTAIYTNNPDVMSIIVFKLRKEKKHDPTCYVVRS